uniref:Uncharacterized protein n=1 Tax=Oryza glumipatula TaxID=40148 RepID=A0A0E0A9R1_9ORYZ
MPLLGRLPTRTRRPPLFLWCLLVIQNMSRYMHDGEAASSDEQEGEVPVLHDDAAEAGEDGVVEGARVHGEDAGHGAIDAATTASLRCEVRVDERQGKR